MSSARYRCDGCGNLTRFDVVTDRRTRAFHHYTVGGALTVEEEEVLAETVAEVSCRWCGHGRAIEVLDEEPGADSGVGPAGARGEPGSPSHPSATLSATTSDREPGDG
ncbi:MAG TPA: hypothetical protein VKR22_15685 [Acidimicrobiales bacterium]|nr:hypothetical protein [Acidimicrobiales bacterium]